MGASRRPTLSWATWWAGMRRSKQSPPPLSILICFRAEDDAALAGQRVEPDRVPLLDEPLQDALDERASEPADERRTLRGQLVERAVAGPDPVLGGVRLEAAGGQRRRHFLAAGRRLPAELAAEAVRGGLGGQVRTELLDDAGEQPGSQLVAARRQRHGVGRRG